MGEGREAGQAETKNFNGAMAVRPWMVRLGVELDAVGELQWGHGREAMDGRQEFNTMRVAYELQWGHGREAMDGTMIARYLPTARRTSMGPWP